MSTVFDRIACIIDQLRMEITDHGLSNTAAMERAVSEHVQSIAELIMPTWDQRKKLDEVRFDTGTLTLLVQGFSVRPDSSAIRGCLGDLRRSLDALERSLADATPRTASASPIVGRGP